MERRLHYYVSRKNLLTWLMALCLVGSAVARIAIPCVKGSGDSLEVWSQIVLPVAATLLYVLIALLGGKEFFYKTSIPVLLLAIYYMIDAGSFMEDRFLIVIYRAVQVFYFLIYAMVISGRFRSMWILYPLFAAPLAFVLSVLEWESFSQTSVLMLLPDALLAAGIFLLSFAVRLSPQDEYHPTWGDRCDGRRIRSLPAMSQVSPYIMVTRNSSTNYFEVPLEISHIERYIRRKRKEGLASFGLNDVLLACYVRTLCRYPGLNRFLAGQKVYSRGDDIQYCMVIKKEMSAEAPDTVIKVHLSPKDTADDVYRKLHEAVENVKNTPLDSGFDNLTYGFTMIPGVFLKFFVWLLRTLDYFGLLPKALLELSPFHGSVFFTSMGSLGIPAIYHHLYDFGNMPVFGSFGCKRREMEIQEDGSVIQRKYVDVKFTMDERIADGYYYAAFFKHYKRILLHPEVLDNPPEEIVKDID